uniref:non-specific serine/threonine protein kinase n=1 Tax=Parastrongyloides trichosuri TaxID=131310 RepID=A0A0N4ZIA6_PARTI
MAVEDGPAELEEGKVIGRFKIEKKIGEGACGAVYLCSETSTGKYAALKAELISNYGNGLKLEVQILKRLAGKKHFADLFSCGKTPKFCYMVITFLGTSLSTFIRAYELNLSESTVVRTAIQMLYSLKQVHEIGIVHRDMKPANLTIGRFGVEKKMIHIIDFGLSREITIIDNGKIRLRKPRERCLFRGTIKYCSVASLEKVEQGRGDDLISVFYICAEFFAKLPWSASGDKTEVLRLKKEIPDSKLFTSCPEMGELLTYCKKLKYNDRPDYGFIYTILYDLMIKRGYKYSDQYDWEPLADTLNNRFLSKEATKSIVSPTLKIGDNELTAEMTDKFFETHFTKEEFNKNVLGF